MVGLIRDWLLDPTALLFMFTLVVGLILIRIVCVRRPRRESIHSDDPVNRNGLMINRWFFVLIGLWLAAFAVFTAPVVVNPLVVSLEQLPLREQPCEAGSHVVVLGGGVDSRIQSAQDFGRMSSATFIRATHAAHIALMEPDVTLIVAGGALGEISEAQVITQFMIAMGVPESRLLLELNSSNTRENALNVSQLLQAEPVTGPVRLVSSALHMYRALSSFQQAMRDSNIEMCPVSVDVQGLRSVAPYAWMPQTTSLLKFDLWLHEVIAVIVYRLKGWI